MATAFPISFEFFPTKTPEGAAKHVQVRKDLYARNPEFCSVTYGAGGSTQAGTFSMVRDIQAEGMQAACHFSCIGATSEKVRSELQQLKDMGVKRIMALRGDLPSGYGLGGEFHYASDLVAFIRKEFGDWFHIEVAAYPETHPRPSRPMQTCVPLPPRSRPVPIAPSRNTSTTSTHTCVLLKGFKHLACRFRSFPVSCRSPILLNSCAFPMRQALRFPAGFACACRPMGTM